MKNMQIYSLTIIVTILILLSGVSRALEVDIQTDKGKTLSGTLSGVVHIETEFGSQKIPASMIVGIHGGKDSLSSSTWMRIYALNGLFAAKGNESDKDGFVRVPNKGGVIDTKLGNIEGLPKNNVSEIKVIFHGAHFAGEIGSGYFKIEFLGKGNRRITGINFDIANMINDWRIYKLKEKLKKYEEKIKISKQTLSHIKLFAHPGNWAIVVRGLEISVR
ncbi:secreted protein [Candidatus Magnetomorum sp. HK-1]|nr:secreted protein [Candidatus Magnetomorum sp. HK-1]